MRKRKPYTTLNQIFIDAVMVRLYDFPLSIIFKLELSSAQFKIQNYLVYLLNSDVHPFHLKHYLPDAFTLDLDNVEKGIREGTHNTNFVLYNGNKIPIPDEYTDIQDIIKVELLNKVLDQ